MLLTVGVVSNSIVRIDRAVAVLEGRGSPLFACIVHCPFRPCFEETEADIARSEGQDGVKNTRIWKVSGMVLLPEDRGGDEFEISPG
uniref:Uncharacterized protein n=1 Tax=Thermosporothrix sp. COM3 TaxID=2490863 RepID=A0A455SI02_9CHLR|nr:hypothetical protein KTC_28540 [Thermosporothrix sp. COM3]